MGLLTRAGDLVYTFRFIKLLVTQFEDTDAFKLGVIDKNGKKLKSPSTGDEKSAYTPFHRLVFNIKKLMDKVPGGGSKIASYAAALYLIKENYIKNEDKFDDILKEMKVENVDFLSESSNWFVLENQDLAPGNYRLYVDKVDNVGYNDIIKAGDRIIVKEKSSPVGNMFGMNIYEAVHYNSKQTLYITIGEIYK